MFHECQFSGNQQNEINKVIIFPFKYFCSDILMFVIYVCVCVFVFRMIKK